jgi:hypothetical protein
MPRADDAHRRERVQAGPNAWPAHANLRREIAFGRQAIAAAQRPALDQRPDMGDNLVGAAFN